MLSQDSATAMLRAFAEVETRQDTEHNTLKSESQGRYLQGLQIVVHLLGRRNQERRHPNLSR